jgi:hypothetical protein
MATARVPNRRTKKVARPTKTVRRSRPNPAEALAARLQATEERLETVLAATRAYLAEYGATLDEDDPLVRDLQRLVRL